MMFARYTGKSPPWAQLQVRRPGEGRPQEAAPSAPREATAEELAVILELPLGG